MKKYIKLFSIIIFLIIVTKANTTLATTTFNRNTETIECIENDTISIYATTDINNPQKWNVTVKSDNNEIVAEKSNTYANKARTIVLECKKSGTTKVSIDANEVTGTGMSSDYSITLTINVITKEKAQEKANEAAKNKANEAAKELENEISTTANKNPNELTNLKDIVYFIIGNSANGGNFFHTYNQSNYDIVKKWENMLEDFKNENNTKGTNGGFAKIDITDSVGITKGQINNAIKILKEFIEEYNKYSESSTVPTAQKDTYTEQFTNETKNIGEKSIEEAKEEIKQKILISLSVGSKGESRNQTVFKNDVLDDPSAYNPRDPSSEEDSEAATIIDKILSLITTIGTVISVLMLAILGVKYMLGSVEEKAEYKKDLVPYFIGAALLFGICTVVKILQSLGDTINNL